MYILYNKQKDGVWLGRVFHVCPLLLHSRLANVNMKQMSLLEDFKLHQAMLTYLKWKPEQLTHNNTKRQWLPHLTQVKYAKNVPLAATSSHIIYIYI